MTDSNNMLSVLSSLMPDNPEEIANKISKDFRRRRVEKNLTRDDIATKAGISVSNIVRFEQKGLISLTNLIAIATAIGYTSEIESIFSEPKYDTMEELLEIRKNKYKKRAYPTNRK